MTRLVLRKGTKVPYAGETVVIVAMQGFDVATVQTATGEYLDVPVQELMKGNPSKRKANLKVDIKRQEKVPQYKLALQHLLDRTTTREEVEAAGKALGIGPAATYEALARYKVSGKPEDLPPPTKPGGRGKSRLDPRIERIIEKEIETKLLKRGNKDVDAFIKNVRHEVQKLGLEVSVSTLTNRAAKIPPWKWKSRRSGYDEAEKDLAPHVGGHPGAVAPLAQIQCDHWYTDMDLVSDDRLTVIGRAWATIAIDIHSRVVWGMYIGLASPSVTTLGLAMINGFLHKEPMLRELGIDTTMPIYGRPREILLDNAGEFTGRSIQASADHFGIDLTWRPVRKPQYGAHIERLNATLAKKFRDLPGATGSKATERKAFRSEATAAFTLDDLRRQMWAIVDEYHNKPHLGLLGKTPLEAWTGHYFGPKGAIRPPPPAWSDDDELRMYWYPLEKRSMQRYGIEIDYLFYYNESIQELVRNYKLYNDLRIRRHPLDVRRIYLLHPLQETWVELPCRLLGFPAASLVDLRKAKREALKTTRKLNGGVLRDIIERNQAYAEEAKKKTRTAAKEEARRADEARRRKTEGAAKAKGVPAAQPVPKAPPPTQPVTPAAGFKPPETFASVLADLRNEDVEAMFDD